MPKITFSPKGPEIDVRSGTEFLEMHRKIADFPIRFGCQNGDCGVCAFNVLEGKENLSQISPQEKETLQKKGLSSSYRLACQCAVNGSITIEYQESP